MSSKNAVNKNIKVICVVSCQLFFYSFLQISLKHPGKCGKKISSASLQRELLYYFYFFSLTKVSFYVFVLVFPFHTHTRNFHFTGIPLCRNINSLEAALTLVGREVKTKPWNGAEGTLECNKHSVLRRPSFSDSSHLILSL